MLLEFFTGNATFAYTPGMTVPQIVTGIAAAITALSGTSGYTAAPSLDGFSIVLTATTPGATGNLSANSRRVYLALLLLILQRFIALAAVDPAWTNLVVGVDGDRVGGNSPFFIENVSTTGSRWDTLYRECRTIYL